MLGLKHENFEKKLQFQVFMDKVANFIFSNLKDGRDLTPLFKKMEGPKPSLIKKGVLQHCPTMKRKIISRWIFIKKNQVVCLERV